MTDSINSQVVRFRVATRDTLSVSVWTARNYSECVSETCERLRLTRARGDAPRRPSAEAAEPRRGRVRRRPTRTEGQGAQGQAGRRARPALCSPLPVCSAALSVHIRSAGAVRPHPPGAAPRRREEEVGMRGGSDPAPWGRARFSLLGSHTPETACAHSDSR